MQFPEGALIWSTPLQMHEKCVRLYLKRHRKSSIRLISSFRIPTLSAAEGKEWSALFTVLTEFCDCSLEQSVDRVLVEAGDEEHLARVRSSFIARPTLSTHYISHYGGAPQSGHFELGHLNKQDTFHHPNMNNSVIRTLSGPKMSRLVGVHSIALPHRLLFSCSVWRCSINQTRTSSLASPPSRTRHSVISCIS